MSKLTLLLLVFLFLQVGATSPRSLVEEAQQQLDQLKNKVEGTILTAQNQLSTIEVNFLTNSDTVLTSAIVYIERQDESLQHHLRVIRDLANSANADISSCTDVREELLNRLPEEYIDLVRSCIVDIDRQEAGLISQAKYIVDVAINKVHNLEFQITQCRDELLCISSLLNEIELDKIRIPQNINSEVQAVEELLTTLKLSVRECYDGNISEYAAEAGSLLYEITTCANNIIG